MSQERFAEVLDISVDFLSLMERGRNASSFELWTGLPIA
jgi:DNA-binding transcriptional regulator YiaG